jgi:hypothetical protein
MFKSILEFLQDIFKNPVIRDDLEAYIVSNNPQNAGDVEKLEREFYTQRKYLTGWDS